MTAIEVLKRTLPAKMYWQSAQVTEPIMGTVDLIWFPHDPFAVHIQAKGPWNMTAIIDAESIHTSIDVADGKFHRQPGAKVGVCYRSDMFGIVIEGTGGALFCLMRPQEVVGMDHIREAIMFEGQLLVDDLVTAELEGITWGAA